MMTDRDESNKRATHRLGSADTEALPDEVWIPPVAPPVLQPGVHVGRFEVARELGRGGMGSVWLARDRELGREVALKFIRSALLSDRRRAMFLDEARFMASFDHPNIVSIYHSDFWEGEPYLALQLVRGSSLRERLTRGAVPAAEVLAIGRGVAAALVSAHHRRVIHRDLKPRNILLSDDADVRVLLADFGLAQRLGATAALPLPLLDADAAGHTRRAAGTERYMAPEQWRQEPLTMAVDVWALGVVLHELLEGVHPFVPDPTSPRERTAAAITGYREAPRLTNATAPQAVRALVEACLAPDPADRPAADEVLARLDAGVAAMRKARAGSTAEAFPGLQRFGRELESVFFGRDTETRAALRQLDARAVLPILGPAGTGKSSLARAGVLARLEADGWCTIAVEPGRQPFERLADSLVAAGHPADPELSRRLREDAGALNVALHELASQLDRKVVLLVDQLEQSCVHLADEAHALEHYTELVARAASDPAFPVRVVLTLRDDFIGRLSASRAMRRVLGRALVIPPLGEHALRDAVTGPLAGLDEAGVRAWPVDAILADLARCPSPLPLLQFTCRALWDRRDGGGSLAAHYETMGGVPGALAQHADEVVMRLGQADAPVARRLLLRLVTPDGAGRIVPRSVLEALDERAGAVLDALIDARLVAPRAASVAGEEAELQLAHDALVTHWDRLARWLKERQGAGGLVDAIEDAASSWRDGGHRGSDLWRGHRLQRVAQSRSDTARELSSLAERFVAASQRARKRRRWLGIVVAATIVGALFSSGILLAALLDAWGDVDTERGRTEALHTDQLLAAMDMGRFELRLRPFDWDPRSGVRRPVGAAELPDLDWRFHVPDEADPTVAARRMTHPSMVREPVRFSADGTTAMQVVEAPGEPVVLEVWGRGRAGRRCASSWIPLRTLPGFSDRDRQPMPAVRVELPTCAASGAGMRSIAGGWFVFDAQLEADAAPKDGAGPATVQRLPGFRIDETEVTHGAYAWYGSAPGVQSPGLTDWPATGPLGGADAPGYPVTNVDQGTAAAFCRYLGKRLPTAQEWTRAARGGGASATGELPRRAYPWGSDPAPERANLRGGDDGHAGPAPVGSMATDVSPDGVLDMAGNVSEWTATASSTSRDQRHVAGGYWYSDPSGPFHAIWFLNERHRRFFNYGVGFRCVADE